MDLFDQKGIRPMLISEQVEPYDDEDSIFELKLDGCRCIAYLDGRGVELRNKRDRRLSSRFPELEHIHQNCRGRCILDGELIVPVNGRPDFYELQKRTLAANPFKIKLSVSRNPAAFVAYDILYADGKQLTQLPLMERKQILAKMVDESAELSVSRYIETQGKALFEMAKQQELEGVVGKKMSSLYWFGKRTKEWQKVKWMKDEDFVCIGYIPKEQGMTSLVLAKYDESGRLLIITHVTLGVSRMKIKQGGIREGRCVLEKIPDDHKKAVWLEPVVCTVAYMPSERGGYRQPVFKGFREDKMPEECRL